MSIRGAQKHGLHDATLLRIEMDWASSTVVMHLRAGKAGEVRLTVTGASHLECPHRNPWGPSVSINEVRGPSTTPSGAKRVEIEMQSGDVLVVEGDTLVLPQLA
jgi:hypothetical protein